MSKKVDSPQTRLAARLAAEHAAFLKTPAGAEWREKVEYLRSALGVATDTGLSLSEICAFAAIISGTNSLETHVSDPNMIRNPDVGAIILSFADRLQAVGEKMCHV